MSRKKLTWEYFGSVRRSWRPGYELDFSSVEPRKFREEQGIRVYESGLIEIRSPVSGNPELRNVLNSTYSLDFRLVSETTNLVFRTGDGEVVHKKYIKSDMLLLDWETGRAFAYSNWARNGLVGITLVHPDAIPVSRMLVEVNQPDRERIKELKALHKETIDVLVTTYSLSSAAGTNVHNELNRMLRGEPLDPITLTYGQQVTLGGLFSGTRANETFGNNVRRVQTHPHIYFSTKE